MIIQHALAVAEAQAQAKKMQQALAVQQAQALAQAQAVAQAQAKKMQQAQALAAAAQATKMNLFNASAATIWKKNPHQNAATFIFLRKQKFPILINLSY
jgi:hypothetical protein